MTEFEGRTVAVAGAVLLAASLIRWGGEFRRPPPLLPGDTGETAALLAASAELLEEEERRRRPLAPGELLDPNVEGEVELNRLPGVGPATARAIVRSREESGPFTSVDDLVRVPGVGSGTLERMRPHLVVARALHQNVAGTRPGPLDLNRATPEELERLPGIGPALARRIVEHRATRGPFRRVEDLVEVPGIGPATLEQLRERIRAGP